MLASAALFFALFALPAVHAHGALTAVTGDNGVNGQGFGIIDSTPRDGSSPVPFEQDTSIIRNNEIASGKASPCGRTKAGGVNDIESNVAAASSAGLPSASADGTVTMTLHQVNQDGAGPYTCEVSTDATGENFQAMKVTTQVPGVFSLSGTTATDLPLVAQMPAGATCTGGPDGNACIVRCRNKAIAGPFGGCVAVTDAAGGAAAGAGAADTGNATAAAAPAAADAAAAPAAAAAKPAKAKAAKGVKAAGAGKAAGKKGGLKGLLGKLGGANKKRMVKSRVVARNNAGLWI